MRYRYSIFRLPYGKINVLRTYVTQISSLLALKMCLVTQRTHKSIISCWKFISLLDLIKYSMQMRSYQSPIKSNNMVRLLQCDYCFVFTSHLPLILFKWQSGRMLPAPHLPFDACAYWMLLAKKRMMMMDESTERGQKKRNTHTTTACERYKTSFLPRDIQTFRAYSYNLSRTRPKATKNESSSTVTETISIHQHPKITNEWVDVEI